MTGRRYTDEDRGYKTPCWVWQGARSGDDYPRMRVGTRFAQAHRVFYETHVGPIADGLQLDHLCRVTLCVNPDHLEPVTPAENMHRSQLALLTADQAGAIRASNDPTRVLAERYGVSKRTVQAVRAGERWRTT